MRHTGQALAVSLSAGGSTLRKTSDSPWLGCSTWGPVLFPNGHHYNKGTASTQKLASNSAESPATFLAGMWGLGLGGGVSTKGAVRPWGGARMAEPALPLRQSAGLDGALATEGRHRRPALSLTSSLSVPQVTRSIFSHSFQVDRYSFDFCFFEQLATRCHISQAIGCIQIARRLPKYSDKDMAN